MNTELIICISVGTFMVTSIIYYCKKCYIIEKNNRRQQFINNNLRKKNTISPIKEDNITETTENDKINSIRGVDIV